MRLAEQYSNTRGPAGEIPVFVDAQNVADYYWEGTPQEEWDWFDDFPNLAPPWPVFVAFWDVPKYINSEGKISQSSDAGWQCVALIHAAEIKSDPIPLPSGKILPTARPLRWILNVSLEVAPPEGYDIGGPHLHAMQWVAIDDKGHVLDTREYPKHEELLTDYLQSIFAQTQGTDKNSHLNWNWPVTMMAYYGHLRGTSRTSPDAELRVINNEQSRQAAGNAASVHFRPAYLAMCFANARNVAVRLNQPDKALYQRQLKRGRTPIHKWYTLEIGPIKDLLRNARDANNQPAKSLQQALHICRGHWKDYSEHGLFGRIKGTFWWPAHERGSVEAGTIEKDYEVTP